MNDTITAIPGVHVGHATVEAGTSGCTVLLGPFRASCDVRGLATGTRELEALSPTHLVPSIDAVLFTGGSAFGLAAAHGVMEWLAEQGRGFQTPVRPVPIVPTAVLFDLRADGETPTPVTGAAACRAASAQPVAQGRVGAGAGATIGKVRGVEHSCPGGVGSFAMPFGEFQVGALAVLNPLGDVLDYDGRIIAGARADDGAFVDALKVLATQGAGVSGFAQPATNTTLAAVATDAPLTRTALQMLARSAAGAIVRRIAPANTVFDGDVVFALSTSAATRELPPSELLALSAVAQLALEEAILRAARAAQI